MNRSIDTVPFSVPSIGKEEEDAVLEVMRSGWLTTGTVTAEFEKSFASAIGIKHALAVNSGTAGLHLALEGAGVGPGSHVFTSTYTFTATAEVARYLGADPVFIDIEPDGLNIDPQALGSALEGSSLPDNSCIVPVHIAGAMCDMQGIMGLADTHGVPVIEDCAHAFPSSFQGTNSGTFGLAGMFSFYATKTITTGEGGMIVTDNDALAEKMRVLRLHGIDRPVWDRYTGTRANAWEYDVIAAGYKYNMTDIAAAIGVQQLKKAQRFRFARSAAAARYSDALGGFDFIKTPRNCDGHSWHLYVVEIVPDKLTVSRDQFIQLLFENGVNASVHFKPLHLMSYYRKRYGLEPTDFPNATDRYQNVVSLPLFPDITEEQIDHVIRAIETIGTNRRKRVAHAGC